MSSIYQGFRSYLWKAPESSSVEVISHVGDDVPGEKVVLVADINERGDKVSEKKLEDESASEEKTQEDEEKIEDEEEELTSNYRSNKKTDELTEPVTQPSMVWRMSSGLYSTATGAVGMGVGGIKWAASKSYNVGSTVVSHVKVPTMPSIRRKNKKE